MIFALYCCLSRHKTNCRYSRLPPKAHNRTKSIADLFIVVSILPEPRISRSHVETFTKLLCLMHLLQYRFSSKKPVDQLLVLFSELLRLWMQIKLHRSLQGPKLLLSKVNVTCVCGHCIGSVNSSATVVVLPATRCDRVSPSTGTYVTSRISDLGWS